MTFLELVKKRCSIRQFSSKAIEKEKLEYIIEAARLAPSAVNFQPWKFFVVKSDEGVENIKSCYSREWIKTVPMFIVACEDHSQSWKRGSDGKDHADIDVAIAVEHICLAAAEQGLGTCWVCNFDVARCKEVLNLPENIEPAVIIPLGYPEREEQFAESVKKRKGTEEIVSIL